MSFDRPAPGTDDPTCRFGASRMAFRGPSVDVGAAHVVMLGSSEVLGRYAPRPASVALAEALDCPVANLGVQNAGLDVFVGDDALLEAAAAATAAVVQVIGAQNLSNRLYSVHPRRNDRFLRPSDRLRALYPEVDFSDYVFTRHLLGALRDRDGMRFETVVEELREAWSARMRLLLSRIGCPTVLLTIDGAGRDALGHDPLYVMPCMVADLAPQAAATVSVDVASHLGQGCLDEMVFEPAEIEGARAALPPAAHEAVAAALAPVLAPLVAGGVAPVRPGAPTRRGG